MIYLDNNASTQVDPRVIAKLEKHLKECIGNPSSMHAFGRKVRGVLTQSRDTIAALLRVKSKEIIFTSGATEALNLLLRGLPRGHIITSDVEHIAVYKTVQELGVDVTFLKTGQYGAVSPEQVEEAIRDDTAMIVLMSVNNETGVKTDIESIANIARVRGIPFVVDGVAQLGKELFTIPEGVSAICFSGQKIHAPKGTGFAFVRSGLKIKPTLTGGQHEYGLRAGTENVPGIVALAEAVKLAFEELPAAMHHMERLRNRLETELKGVIVNGTGPRVCNTSNLSFPGVDGESLLTALDMRGIAVSHGSACSSGALEPSRVLTNMGLPKSRIHSSIRITTSRFTTDEEISTFIDVVKQLKVGN